MEDELVEQEVVENEEVVEQEVEETEGEAEETEEATSEEEKPKKSKTEKGFARLTRKYREEERKAQVFEGENKRLQSELERFKEIAKEKGLEIPQSAEPTQPKQQVAPSEELNSLVNKTQTYMNENPDFLRKMTADNDFINNIADMQRIDGLREIISESDIAGRIVEYLGDNYVEMDKLVGLSPLRMARKISDIEDKLAAKKTKNLVTPKVTQKKAPAKKGLFNADRKEQTNAFQNRLKNR